MIYPTIKLMHRETYLQIMLKSKPKPKRFFFGNSICENKEGEMKEKSESGWWVCGAYQIDLQSLDEQGSCFRDIFARHGLWKRTRTSKVPSKSGRLTLLVLENPKKNPFFSITF